MAEAENIPQNNGDYGADSITILEGLEAVRKRPGMYIGSTGERGLHHLIWEVVDNSVDEAMAGYADKVEVTLHDDGSVEVADNGRGIPVEMHPTGRPTVQVVMTELHAGGKFDSQAYAVSGGLHGVGISVVNALSTRVETQITRDGYLWNQKFNNSLPEELVQVKKARGTGTRQRFWADPAIFETTTYNFETVSRRLQEMAFLNKGLTITLTDERKQIVEEEVEAESVAAEATEDAAAPKTEEERAAEASGETTPPDGESAPSGEGGDAAAQPVSTGANTVPTSDVDAQYGIENYAETFAVQATAGANIRQTPSQDGEIIGVVVSGTSVTALGATDRWYKIDYNGTVGYVNRNLFAE